MSQLVAPKTVLVKPIQGCQICAERGEPLKGIDLNDKQFDAQMTLREVMQSENYISSVMVHYWSHLCEFMIDIKPELNPSDVAITGSQDL
jgi:hypothetical protein